MTNLIFNLTWNRGLPEISLIFVTFSMLMISVTLCCSPVTRNKTKNQHTCTQNAYKYIRVEMKKIKPSEKKNKYEGST
jgi:hypothetical protein